MFTISQVHFLPSKGSHSVTKNPNAKSVNEGFFTKISPQKKQISGKGSKNLIPYPDKQYLDRIYQISIFNLKYNSCKISCKEIQLKTQIKFYANKIEP